MKRFRKSIDFVTKILLKILEISIYKLNKLMTNLLWSILLMLNKIKRKKFSGKFKDFKIIMMTRFPKSIVCLFGLILNEIKRKKLSEQYKDFKIIMMKRFKKSIVFVNKTLVKIYKNQSTNQKK